MFSLQRGQALAETIICLPLLIATFFAIFCFAKITMINERMESAVRYANEGASQNDPLERFSLMAFYDAASGEPQLKANCETPKIDTLTTAGGSTKIAPLWSADVAVPACVVRGRQSLPSNMGFSQDLLFGYTQSSISASVDLPINAYLHISQKRYPVQSGTRSFFRAANLADVLHCYAATMNVRNSLAVGANSIDDTPQFSATGSTYNQKPPEGADTVSASCATP